MSFIYLNPASQPKQEMQIDESQHTPNSIVKIIVLKIVYIYIDVKLDVSLEKMAGHQFLHIGAGFLKHDSFCSSKFFCFFPFFVILKFDVGSYEA